MKGPSWQICVVVESKDELDGYLVDGNAKATPIQMLVSAGRAAIWDAWRDAEVVPGLVELEVAVPRLTPAVR